MVKFYGVIFLGQPRETSLMKAHDAGRLERVGLVWLAVGCVVLGAFPQLALTATARITRSAGGRCRAAGLLDRPLPRWRRNRRPTAECSSGPESSAWSRVTFVLVRRLYHGRVRRTAPWDCGYPWQTPRMQDTAEGFGQPIRHIFGSAFRIERELPSPWDTSPRYRIHIEDRIWHALYVPLGRGVQRLAEAVAVIQGGRLAIYLLYAFLTLVALLVFVL